MSLKGDFGCIIMPDDLKLISEIDKSEMLKVVENFSKQIKESRDIVDSAELSSIFKVDNIIISGMSVLRWFI